MMRFVIQMSWEQTHPMTLCWGYVVVGSGFLHLLSSVWGARRGGHLGQFLSCCTSVSPELAQMSPQWSSTWCRTPQIAWNGDTHGLGTSMGILCLSWDMVLGADQAKLLRSAVHLHTPALNEDARQLLITANEQAKSSLCKSLCLCS